MADPSARERKLIQYLNEAYGKEKQLETTLQQQIQLASDRAQLKKRFQEHLKETKAQSRGLEKRIKQLGGKAEAVKLPGPELASEAATAATSAANKVIAAAKGPVQALRGTSPSDNLLHNVRDAVWNEAEEIAHYDAIEALAEALNDRDTAKLAREFRRQEERMQKFLRTQLKQIVKVVVREEVPAKERRANGGRKRPTARKAATARKAGTARKAATTRKAGTTRKASTTARSASSRKSGTTTRKSGTSSRSTASRSASSSRSGSSRSGSSRSSRSSGSRSRGSRGSSSS